MTERYKSWLLTDAKACYRYLQIGFAVIVLTALAGVAVLLVPSLGSVDLTEIYDVMVMPALFIGLGFLLYGVGTHLHIMHLNVLEMRESDDGH